ncbi:hypothetical protein QVD17_19363 [Tagetes erecta]|uniref:Uncharacterized protein n=1 Tax=Tagetes erecta TaxID=13708 RepID=A0AAD8NWW2_TARER|nr:hypothetical protein QVD17_19363 [Tagetes erecta]
MASFDENFYLSDDLMYTEKLLENYKGTMGTFIFVSFSISNISVATNRIQFLTDENSNTILPSDALDVYDIGQASDNVGYI